MKPRDIVSSLQNLISVENSLDVGVENLRNGKSLATVIFFDLIGSTGYRRRYGAEKGLKKAYIHNVHVSRAIVRAGGYVVKWLGDGVMGCFTHEGCGDAHAMKALHAALQTLRDLPQINLQKQHDDEIHTKISICAGAFHYLDVGRLLENGAEIAPEQLDRATNLDPIGTEVDLAARMNAITQMDVILMDERTFWGFKPETESGDPVGVIRGVCKEERASVNWRKVGFPDPRETVYVPHAAGFFVEEDGLVLSRVNKASTDAIDHKKFQDLVSADAGTNGSRRQFIFASQPIPCNIKGFENPVQVISLSLVPQKMPMAEPEYSWHSNEIDKAVKKAEKSFREGKKLDDVINQFGEVLSLDGRHFQANVRTAMILRSQRNTEDAMRHLMVAKRSNPKCPLVWGVAGMTHLDDFLHDRGDKTECLHRAITGFTRAKKLAEDQFHGLMEQYCTAMLAISRLLRGQPEDKAAAKSLVDELEAWPSKNQTVNVLKKLSALFFMLTDSTNKSAALEDLEKLNNNGSMQLSDEAVKSAPYDHLVTRADVHNLVVKAKFLLELD